MKRLYAPPVAVLIVLSAMGQSDSWAPLRVFEGKWEGPTTGKPGKGTTSREYKFELNGQFFSQRDRSVYQPEDPAAKPLVHEDFGFFSYDTNLKRIVWRQFHSEGLVNEYTLDAVSADGNSLQFVATRIENLPPGFRAKKVYDSERRKSIELSPRTRSRRLSSRRLRARNSKCTRCRISSG
jgi:hypothetical protein